MTTPASGPTGETVAAAFDRARSYDAHAQVQRRVAEDLADRIAALPLVQRLGGEVRLLEIGCGTGFLTEALRQHGLGGDWLVTDVAPAMLERCRQRMGAAGHDFALLDGEDPAALSGERFDLVCSSLAFQWFADPLASAAGWARRLRPGGALAFTTLVEGTFAEWAEAHAAFGLASGVHAYPDAALLHQRVAACPGAELSIDTYREHHRDARHFLRALKAIGAGTPAAGHRALTPRELRAVMARFEGLGAVATYRVARVLAPARAALATPVHTLPENAMPSCPARPEARK